MEKVIDEIFKPYKELINNSAALQSLLYDVNLLPEQVTTIEDAISAAYICVGYKAGTRMFEHKELRILETALRNYAEAAQYFTPEHAAEARAVWDKIKNV